MTGIPPGDNHVNTWVSWISQSTFFPLTYVVIAQSLLGVYLNAQLRLRKTSTYLPRSQLNVQCFAQTPFDMRDGKGSLPESCQSQPSPSLTGEHVSTDQFAINDNPVRKFLTLLGLKTTAHLFKRPSRNVFPISRRIMVKTGPFVYLAEGATMKYVAENTSIPVPRVYCSFMHKGRAYIVMERIKGQIIGEAWEHASDATKTSLLRQLKCMMQELRAIRPAHSGVQNCAGGPLYDPRIRHCDPEHGRFGPFKSIQEFHRWLRQDLSLSDVQTMILAENQQDIADMIIKQDGHWPPPVFTHGDLNPTNIMVNDDEIAAIIDWEFSGWYPEYWEYTATWYTCRLAKNWQNLLTEFLETYPSELKMDIVRQKWWGEL